MNTNEKIGDIMKEPESDWYKKIWSLDIKKMSWVEQTEQQVSFLIKTLQLTGDEKILDLACGYGRHSLTLARKGFMVVGVDITSDYIEDAQKTAKKEKLNVEFICSDIRNLVFKEEFDVVLNLADGAIGYLENDNENFKVFDCISNSLKAGGKSFIDICSAEHAEQQFPKRNWEIGKKSVSLPEFSWKKETKRMLYGGWRIEFGKIAQKPQKIDAHSSIRLYTIKEINEIFKLRNMVVLETYSDYTGRPASQKYMQLLVYSRKIPF